VAGRFAQVGGVTVATPLKRDPLDGYMRGSKPDRRTTMANRARIRSKGKLLGNSAKIIGAVTILLIGAGLIAQRVSDGPMGPIPGGPLRTGTLVTEPVIDWSFAKGQSMDLELVEPPGSRTTGAMVLEGQLYVSCDLGFIWRRIPAPARWMASLIYRFKRWHEDALRDGRVVLRIAGKRYERQAVRVTDPEVVAILSSRFEKWAEKTFSSPLGDVPSDGPNDIWFFRMDPRPAK